MTQNDASLVRGRRFSSTVGIAMPDRASRERLWAIHQVPAELLEHLESDRRLRAAVHLFLSRREPLPVNARRLPHKNEQLPAAVRQLLSSDELLGVALLRLLSGAEPLPTISDSDYARLAACTAGVTSADIKAALDRVGIVPVDEHGVFQTLLGIY